MAAAAAKIIDCTCASHNHNVTPSVVMLLLLLLLLPLSFAFGHFLAPCGHFYGYCVSGSHLSWTTKHNGTCQLSVTAAAAAVFLFVSSFVNLGLLSMGAVELSWELKWGKSDLHLLSL